MENARKGEGTVREITTCVTSFTYWAGLDFYGRRAERREGSLTDALIRIDRVVNELPPSERSLEQVSDILWEVRSYF